MVDLGNYRDPESKDKTVSMKNSGNGSKLLICYNWLNRWVFYNLHKWDTGNYTQMIHRNPYDTTHTVPRAAVHRGSDHLFRSYNCRCIVTLHGSPYLFTLFYDPFILSFVDGYEPFQSLSFPFTLKGNTFNPKNKNFLTFSLFTQYS